MDRNQVIGLTLIFALLMVYFQFFAPQPVPKTATQVDTTQIAANTATPNITAASADSVKIDGTPSWKYGTEQEIKIENEDLRIIFSSKGGKVQSVELKNYQTFDKNPLLLLTPENTQMDWKLPLDNQEVGIGDVFFQVKESKKADTSIIAFEANVNGKVITQTYQIAPSGFEVGYDFQANGFEGVATLTWKNDVAKTEMDAEQMRIKTTINYFLADGTFDYLSETSTSEEKATISQPIQWLTYKQKFFNAAIISQQATFTKAELKSYVQGSKNGIKVLETTAQIDINAINANAKDFKFYFGPNDYKILGEIAPEFDRNVYLGWAIFAGVNKFLVMPIFHFFESFIPSYGIVIILLVIVIRSLLFPLAYKSYISMARMRVLKPEIDAIKEKHGDDMQKIQSEQMKLYSQVGINPISGCIPMLLQMPILLAMFYFFPSAIELRGESFWWAEDLSTYDSILNFSFQIPGIGNHISLFTLLMTVSTLGITWYNNQTSAAATQGPMVAITYMMPLIFMFVLNSYPAGLNLYYLVSNVLSLGQQIAIRQFIDDEAIRKKLEENKVKNANKPKSSFQSKLEEALKNQQQKKKNK
jgi:YidC/Oxa1 family membrane protein insertase